MSRFPELRVTHRIGGQPSREIIEFEQAPHFLFNYDVIVAVEGKVIRSYDELTGPAAQERCRAGVASVIISLALNPVSKCVAQIPRYSHPGL